MSALGERLGCGRLSVTVRLDVGACGANMWSGWVRLTAILRHSQAEKLQGPSRDPISCRLSAPAGQPHSGSHLILLNARDLQLTTYNC